LAPAAAHDAAGLPPSRDRPFSSLITRSTRGLQTLGRACVAGEPINLTDDTSELTLDIRVYARIFGARPRPPGAKNLGPNPFEVVAKEQTGDLKFAFRFRSLSKLIEGVIEHRRSEPAEEDDFLSMLMAARDRDNRAAMSNKELIDEVMTLIVAGHETTAAALTWTWYLISQHPAHGCAAGGRGRPHTRRGPGPRCGRSPGVHPSGGAGGIAAYPPGWLFTRRTIEDDQLGGYPVGPRTDVFIQPVHADRHPQFWSDPEEFQPQRFARRGRERAPPLRLHSILRGPAPLHRGEHGNVRDAGAREPHVARFPAQAGGRSTDRARGADQPAPTLQPHDDGRGKMKHKTLVEMFQASRAVDRAITYVEVRTPKRRVSFADVYAARSGSCITLQALGAQRGDKIILFLNNNEQFLDASGRHSPAASFPCRSRWDQR